MRSLPQTCASSIKKLLALFSLMSGGEKIVECVPNFSEGRRADVVEAIAAAVRETEGCSLLDVAPGDSTNRTVYTFVGRPESVLEGALAAARVAFKLIDMTKQKGEHPRLGALDVCPFIPVANVTMEECAELSRRFGCRLATELSVPVYLYEYAVAVGNDRDYRRTLPQIREGEYERLRNKIQKPEWAPDFGPADYIPSWGATVTGARSFLIAYNVNLLATKEQAHRIALNIREQGRGPSQPGRLKAVKAIGWYLDDQDLAQVSINISAEFYIQREGLFLMEERQKVRLAVERLGLASLGEFKPEEKIIEYRVGSCKDGPLLSSSLRAFLSSLSARTSAPGGGLPAS
ncbi:Formimidoyltransferase-cyclodeaminase [Geodia barretti]|uniref:glutamate formimidoyltransferase n=1 Tax=Geodia barretti TaxID=519541 RepID=A0AA35TBS9_GEOBA|nr:Formimidoyltransferase-cyclodeaminase [Geodia barretti]